MKILKLFSALAMVAFSAIVQAADVPIVPTEQDRLVLQLVLTNLLSLKEFTFYRRSKPEEKPKVLLIDESPGLNGFYQPQIKNDIGRPIPAEAFADLCERNTVPGSKRVSYRGIPLGDKVIIGNLPINELGLLKFEEHYPEARGWVMVWLPGYAKDGKSALVRGWTGPSDHESALTAHVVLTNRNWSIDWIKINHRH